MKYIEIKWRLLFVVPFYNEKENDLIPDLCFKSIMLVPMCRRDGSE